MKLRPCHRLAAFALAACLATGAGAAADPKAARLYEDALVRYEKRDLGGAIVQLKNALQIDKTQLPVHTLLGKALLEQGDVLAAEVAFTEALRLGVNRAEVVVPLARTLMAQGKPQEILTGPRFSLGGLPPGTVYALQMVRASAATDLGDLRSALKAVEDARAIDAADPASWRAEASVRMRQRQLKEALAAADKSIALAPAQAEGYYTRGEALHLAVNLKEAMASYDKCLSIAPDHIDALIARAGLYLDMRRLPEASRDTKEVMRLAPREPRAKYLWAVISEREGRTEQARAALNEVTGLLDPVPIEFLRFRPQLLMLGGLSHHGLGQGEKAKPYLEAVLRQQPNHPVSKLLASIYLADRNIDRGIEALEAYLRGTPGDPQAMLQLASAHMAQGRHARATQITQDALKLADTPDLRTTLGLSLVGRGKFADGLKELEGVVAKDPGKMQAAFTLAALYLKGEQPAKAVAVAEALAQRHASNPGVHNLLGTAYRQAGNAAGARGAFEKASKLDPTFYSAQVGLARLDIDAGQYDAAIRRLSDVVNKDGKNIEALMALGEAGERSGQLDKARRWLETADDFAGTENLEPAIALVDFHLRHNQVEPAREASQRAANKNPESVHTLLAQARVALAQGDQVAARTSLTRAANASSTNAPLLVRIALMQMQAAALPGASYSIDKALQERPDYLPALAMRGDLDIRMGELARAEQVGKQLVARHPKLGVGHGILGDLATARGQRDAALEAYRRAHDIDQTTDSLLRLFKATYARDAGAGLRLAEAWLRKRPRDTLVLRGLADAQLAAGNLKAARESYEALVKLRPGDAEALNNLAYALVGLKDPAALPTAERALAASPNAPHIIGTTGWAAFQAGQRDRAVQLLRDARLRDPANPDTRFFLGSVLASAGRAGEAREELSHALKTPGPFANRQAAQELLATLR